MSQNLLLCALERKASLSSRRGEVGDDFAIDSACSYKLFITFSVQVDGYGYLLQMWVTDGLQLLKNLTIYKR